MMYYIEKLPYDPVQKVPLRPRFQVPKMAANLRTSLQNNSKIWQIIQIV